MRIKHAAAAAALLTTTVLPAGCQVGPKGGDPGVASKPPVSVAAKPVPLASHPPAEILRRAEAALRAAGTVKVVGGGSSLELNRRGAKGSLRDGKEPRVEIISLDGRFYLRGRDFWRAQQHGEAVAELFGDRWVDVSDAPPGSGASAADNAAATRVLSFGGFVGAFHKEVIAKGRFTAARELTVAGVAVVRLTGAKGTLDVAARGPAYPLRYDSKDDSEDLTLSAFGQPVVITKPADPVEAGKLAKG